MTTLAEAEKLMLYREVVRDPKRLTEHIAAGADVNGPVFNRMPLAIAVAEGCVESCRILLEAGADPNRAREQSNQDSVLAVLFDHRYSQLNKLAGISDPVIADDVMQAICTMLVEFGANPNGNVQAGEMMSAGQSPLYLAAEEGDVKGVETLVGLGADVNQKLEDTSTYSGATYEKTALSRAKDRQDEKMMITLLRLGADDDCIKYGHLTAFQHCVERGLDQVVEYYVRERGEPLDQTGLIVTARQTLMEMASKERTRVLLRSLATELAVQEAIGSSEGSRPAAVSRKKLGMSPL
jgi:ankyrin repeat protein